MNNLKSRFFTILLLLLGTLSAFCQQKFRISEFALDAFDLTARNDRYKKIDGSGSLYAIIKVSGEEGDNLREYQFNFGNMNHLIEEHDGLLWIYVQKNAKRVTIRRNGYAPLLNHDLQTTIEEGKTYRMKLSAQGPVVYTQMLMFQVQPADAKAVVTLQKDAPGEQKKMLITDGTGGVAKSLELGTYIYEVMAENYHSSEGRFTLNNRLETHVEKVVLRPNGAVVSLEVASDADIYVDGMKKGICQWTGLLDAGTHQVECRQLNHRSSSQTITVTEGNNQSFLLTAPTPINGVLAVTSSPLGASIKIDGKDYGTTPRNIDVLIGQHMLTLNLAGYYESVQTVEAKENETSEISIVMSDVPVHPDELPFTVNGVSFMMRRVEGGSFQMGGKSIYYSAKPIHTVRLSEYYVGKTEVTQELWQAVMGSNPSSFKGENLPVESVSWDDCQEFISKLNQLTGKKFRLPTEAEWEFAARGGIMSKGYKFSGSNTYDKVAWYYENSGDSQLHDTTWEEDKLTANHCRTHQIATKQPNELGIYDMSGNVFEWCQDWYDVNYYTMSPASNPTGPINGQMRVLRGNGWISTRMVTGNIYFRSNLKPTEKTNFIGLRLALSE